METENRGLLDRLLFPESRLLNFGIICCVSYLFSYLLIGRQIYFANWGLVDDHEVFSYLGPNLHLSIGDIWQTLLTKTEVGQLTGRFRPTYYLLKVIEVSFFGADVHLWYFVNTICFALFLSSIWWTLWRFVGLWFGAALTASIALLSMWAHIWARLGPSEIFGTAFAGIMLFAADATLCCKRPASRKVGAIILTLAAIVLGGLKETFLPLAAAGPTFVLAWAFIKGRISPVLAGALLIAVYSCLAVVGLVVCRELRAAGGIDHNAKSAGLAFTAALTTIGIFDALLRTWWLWLLPIVLLQGLKIVPTRPVGQWIGGSAAAFSIYAFLMAMYAAQCGMYRMLFPHNSRYDFPAMLLVPLTCCILACEVFRRLEEHFPDRIVKRTQMIAAGILAFALVNVHLGTRLALPSAVKKNIEVTNSFYPEVERASRAARESPERPIILEAYGPRAYEGVLSLSNYLRALGARNAISVRFHRDGSASGRLYDGLQQSLENLEAAGNAELTPLAKALPTSARGCLSIGLYGSPDEKCAAFRISDG
jgi:hypothetical protein